MTDHHERCTKQRVETVVTNVKCLLNQDKTNQSIAVIASRITSQKEATAVVADLVETEAVADLVETEAVAEAQVDMVEITEAVEVMEETDHHERCTKQRVETVVTNVKYLLNQDKTNQSIAVIASRITSQKDDN